MWYDEVLRSVAALREYCRCVPRLGIVAGSGLGMIAEAVSCPQVIPYQMIVGFPKTTVDGHMGSLVVGEMNGHVVAVLNGRVHLYEGHAPGQVVHAVCTLAAWGAKVMILTNASGAINPTIRPGRPMIMTDHLNLTGHNPLTGPLPQSSPWPRFPDMSRVYDPAIRAILQTAFADEGVETCEGVYAGLAGPSYETPAEIRMLRTLGADAVGMSTVLEAITLNAMGVAIGGISSPANWAAGLQEGETLEHADVLQVALATAQRIGPALLRAVPKLLAL